MDELVFPIAAEKVRYIKLGVGNAWFADCRKHDRLEFGHRRVPHEIAAAGDRGVIAEIYLREGRSPSKASGYAREVLDFFDRDENALWITFAEGCLWWAFARAEVETLGETEHQGQRARRLVAPWSSQDAHGHVLTIGSLSTSLTQVAAYRQTICKVEAKDYLLRKINAEEEPTIAAGRQAQDEMLRAARQLISGLHWRDFEILCDLIFSRSGWQRLSELGGLQKDTDLVLSQTATGERAFVQVKSKSALSELTEYAARFEADPGFDRMFFVCHSFKGELARPRSSKPVHIWLQDEIARQAIAAGLFDWLIQKAG